MGAFDSIGDHNKTLSDDGNDEIPYKIRTGEDNEGLICQALLTGNIEAAMELCFESGRYADAIIIANTGGPELLSRAQFRYLSKSDGYLSNIISALVTDDWSTVITQCTTDSWKEALVATLTHCGDHVPLLCERLGERLQVEGANQITLIQSAILCYICAGNVERLAEAWLAAHAKPYALNGTAPSSTKELQDLVEFVTLFQKALELQGRDVSVKGKLADILSQYAGLLASQGALNSALTYLGPSDDPDIVDLRERLYYALGHKQAYQATRTRTQSTNLFTQTPVVNQFQRASLPNNTFNPLPNNTFNPLPISNNIPPPAPQFNSGFMNNVQSSAPVPQLWNTSAVSQSSQPATSWLPPSSSTLPPTTPNLNPLLPSAQSSRPSVDAGLPPHPPRPSSVSSQSGSGPPTRSKYVLDPSVQSGPTYGQTANLYAPQQSNVQQFNNQPFGGSQSFGGPAPSNNFNQFTPQPFAQAYDQPLSAPAVSSSILNQPQGNYLPGVPPIEVAQQAMLQQMQRNPTPPPGWNDPPPPSKSRQVIFYCIGVSLNMFSIKKSIWFINLTKNLYSKISVIML